MPLITVNSNYMHALQTGPPGIPLDQFAVAPCTTNPPLLLKIIHHGLLLLQSPWLYPLKLWGLQTLQIIQRGNKAFVQVY